ncbi:MAG: 6-bladed beta-propeller [Dysgonamonadaceae bacterium]|jgi:hypothetical protein|nr:6-bladed beta-propeller [Dysgonamonadaceae bacterium]
MIKKYILLLLLVLLSCSRNRNTIENVKEINVGLNRNSIKASDFIEKFEVIKLETNDSCLIGQISKIQYIDDKIYLLDNNSVFVFNKDGRFDKKLSKRGGGPEEYIQIMDFEVRDGFLYVLDFSKQSILKYNLNLDFRERSRFATISTAFAVKDGNCWIYNEPGGTETDCRFSCIDFRNGDSKNFVPQKFNTCNYNWSDVNIFSSNSKDLFASPKFGNTVYLVQKNSIEPVFQIRFDNDGFPENENICDYDISSPNFNFVIKHNFYLSDKYLILEYFHKQKRYFCIHELADGNTVSGIVENDLIKDFRFFPRWGTANFLFDAVDAQYVTEDFAFLSDYNEEIKSIKEDDNPVVVIYTLKTDSI